ncbi:MAG: hypothetical protein M1817_003695 [Caeruleum heppii]|nr:MAG: hypothetical protein M1817_003695 [Caeruleum heppii]
MPVKWTAEKDQLLLLKILETHPQITVDGQAIIDVWPVEEGQEKPTPRAISERLVRIRKNAGATFSVSAAPRGKDGTGTDGTPSKGGKRGKNAAAASFKGKGNVLGENTTATTNGGTKRKRGGGKAALSKNKSTDNNEDGDYIPPGTSTSSCGKTVKIKSEPEAATATLHKDGEKDPTHDWTAVNHPKAKNVKKIKTEPADEGEDGPENGDLEQSEMNQEADGTDNEADEGEATDEEDQYDTAVQDQLEGEMCVI